MSSTNRRLGSLALAVAAAGVLARAFAIQEPAAKPGCPAEPGRRPPAQIDNNPPPTPVLLSPRDVIVITGTPEFSWTPVIDPEGDSVIFEIQIDEDPEFESPEVDIRGGTRAAYTPERPLPDGVYCWRVRAIDDIDAKSPFSGASSVTIRATLEH